MDRVYRMRGARYSNNEKYSDRTRRNFFCRKCQQRILFNECLFDHRIHFCVSLLVCSPSFISPRLACACIFWFHNFGTFFCFVLVRRALSSIRAKRQLYRFSVSIVGALDNYLVVKRKKKWCLFNNRNGQQFWGPERRNSMWNRERDGILVHHHRYLCDEIAAARIVIAISIIVDSRKY